MGVDEGNLQVIDVGMITENCPITLRYILTSSNYGVEMKEYRIIRLAKSSANTLFLRCYLFSYLFGPCCL